MCEFCLPRQVLMENETCFVVKGVDAISYGHMLIVSKRHVASYFDLTYEEMEGMNQLLRNTKAYVDKMIQPDGYNVAINDGVWSGQSTPHAALHLIPRYAGDVPATELKGGLLNFKGKTWNTL